MHFEVCLIHRALDRQEVSLEKEAEQSRKMQVSCRHGSLHSLVSEKMSSVTETRVLRVLHSEEM